MYMIKSKNCSKKLIKSSCISNTLIYRAINNQSLMEEQGTNRTVKCNTHCPTLDWPATNCFHFDFRAIYNAVNFIQSIEITWGRVMASAE